MIENKKILIYIGANQGFGLTGLLYREQFDIVIAFEPDPEMYQLLLENIKFGLLSKINQNIQYIAINAACSLENSIKNLYIFENRVATSLGNANFDKDKSLIKNIIEVPTINLYDYLISNNINYIDYLVTDCQGSDLDIIRSIKNYIEESKIGKIFCETHRDDYNLYQGLCNDFSEFKKILSSNYKIEYFSFDGIIKDSSYIPIEDEWDTYWVKK